MSETQAALILQLIYLLMHQLLIRQYDKAVKNRHGLKGGNGKPHRR